VEPTAIALILEDADKDMVDFQILAVVMAAVALATVAVQASLPFKTKLCPSWLDCQLLLSNTSLTVSAKIPSGDGMKQMQKNPGELKKNKGQVVLTQERFFL
jgi:hypothetical protein